jgi:hypothetical protein
VSRKASSVKAETAKSRGRGREGVTACYHARHSKIRDNTKSVRRISTAELQRLTQNWLLDCQFWPYLFAIPARFPWFLNHRDLAEVGTTDSF